MVGQQSLYNPYRKENGSSVRETNHLQDLEETFKIRRHYGVKLNCKSVLLNLDPNLFLGCMVDQIGIEVNPSNVQAMLNMKSSMTVKEVHKWTSYIAVLMDK